MEEKYQNLAVGEMVISPEDKEYELVPDGEPLKVHIANVQKVKGSKYGEPDVPETKLSVGFELDEDIAGKGQVYTQWFTPSLNPKSKLAQMINALFGELKPFDPAKDLVGQPLRIVLINKDKEGTTKQYIQSFLKAATDQKFVKVETETDKMLAELPSDDDIAAAFDV